MIGICKDCEELEYSNSWGFYCMIIGNKLKGKGETCCDYKESFVVSLKEQTKEKENELRNT